MYGITYYHNFEGLLHMQIVTTYLKVSIEKIRKMFRIEIRTDLVRGKMTLDMREVITFGPTVIHKITIEDDVRLAFL